MDEYRHHVTGIFANREEAEGALSKLVERGVPRGQLQVFAASPGTAGSEVKGDNTDVLTNVLVDSSIGAAVGTGIGALAEVALIAANVTLFVASPLIGPLAMLGWGASLGAVVGGAMGAQASVEHKDGRLADLVRDAISSGQVVLIAETRTVQETATATEVIGAAVGEDIASSD
ncbi:MAG TPA: hypothetical protein VFW68_09395 [Rhodocyclaceae bacterium]|nr:hypothetical protein [Rhodocyclaceae bacterium]